MYELRNDQITKMAKALVDNAIALTYGDSTPYCLCDFCNAEPQERGYSAKDLKHDIRCPVLIVNEVSMDV